MQRRDFLFSAAASIAAAAGAVRTGFAQDAGPPAADQPGAGRQGGGRRGGGAGAGQGRGQGAPAPIGDATPYPRNPKAAARIAVLSLDFAGWIKDLPDVTPGPQRTIAFFDLPQMLADVYDVHMVEFQDQHFESNTPAYFKSLRAALAKSKSRATQINANFAPGVHMSGATLAARQEAVIMAKARIDQAVQLGALRVMVNQAHLSLGRGNLPEAIDAFKQMADYGKSKNIRVSIETRGGQPPAVPRTDLPAPGLETWQMMKELITKAGGYANPDVGNANAMNQQELHQCLSKELLFPTAGNMHCRVNMNWDLTTAIKYLNGLGYTGHFSVEANAHTGVRPVYEAIVAGL